MVSKPKAAPPGAEAAPTQVLTAKARRVSPPSPGAPLADVDIRRIAKAALKKTSTMPSGFAATTVRLEPELRQRLEVIRELRKVPLNDLIHEGMLAYANAEAARLEASLQSALEAVRRVRQIDPGFSNQLAQLAADEAAIAGTDPVEGQRAQGEPTSTALSLVRQLTEAG